MRLLLGGRAGRFVGMLSGLAARGIVAFGALGVTGGLTIEAESAGAAVWASAFVSNPMPSTAVTKTRATMVPGSVLIAQDFMGFSAAATYSWKRVARPFGFVTPERAEDSFFAGPSQKNGWDLRLEIQLFERDSEGGRNFFLRGLAQAQLTALLF